MDIYSFKLFGQTVSFSMPVWHGPETHHPHKTKSKYKVITYLPVKDNIQLFPIPDTEDVYPVAELLLKQNKTKLLIILLNCIIFHPSLW